MSAFHLMTNRHKHRSRHSMNTKDRTIFISSSKKHYQSDLSCEDSISNIAGFSNTWNILSFIRVSLMHIITRFMRVHVRPTRENREATAVIVPSRSIGLPAILRLRQRFFVKKELRARYHPIMRHVTHTHACPSNSDSREWKTARSANRRAMQRGDSSWIAGKSVPEN